ncbi:MAG: RNA polymerase sigma factor, partial [Acidobacteriota bacterium]
MTDERDLIARCRRGDQRAFESLVLRKRDKALRIAFNIVGDEDDAKDIVQQAFIRVWSLFDSFDEASRFDPWFHRIVVNLAIDHYRREHKRMNVSLSSGGLESEAVPPAMWSRQGADERL